MLARNALTVTTPDDREICMTRSFQASRDRVFEAITRPDLVQRWLLGPDGWTMPVCEIDLREGGAFRYVWRRDRDGHEMAVGGTFVEVDPPRRLVHTELFEEDWTDGEALVTQELREDQGVTTLTMTIRYSSPEARDGALKSGMETGVERSYERLDEMFASAA